MTLYGIEDKIDIGDYRFEIDFASMLVFAVAIWQRFQALYLTGREVASEAESQQGMRPRYFR